MNLSIVEEGFQHQFIVSKISEEQIYFLEEGVFMGKLLIVEFSDEEETAFEKVIQLLRYDYDFSSLSLPEENILSFFCV